METVLERLARGSRVAFIRLRSLGDCVLTTPAIEILRRSRPDLKIAVVVETRFAAVFENNPDIDAVLPPRLADLRRWGPDLVINLHGGTRSLALTSACNARFRAGFAHLRGARLYNVRVPTAQEILGIERKVHTAEHLASVIFHLGAERCEVPKAKLFATGTVEPRPIAVIHPLASAPDKTWPAENFVAIAACLRDRWRLEPVFIGNDSGPAHMAAALDTPLVVLFGNSDPVIWAPWKATAEVLIADRPIQSILVDQVLMAVERLPVTA